MEGHQARLDEEADSHNCLEEAPHHCIDPSDEGRCRPEVVVDHHQMMIMGVPPMNQMMKGATAIRCVLDIMIHN